MHLSQRQYEKRRDGLKRDIARSRRHLDQRLQSARDLPAFAIRQAASGKSAKSIGTIAACIAGCCLAYNFWRRSWTDSLEQWALNLVFPQQKSRSQRDESPSCNDKEASEQSR